jgi:hypothetical protein
MTTSNLTMLLERFLSEGETPQYDPKTGSLFAIKEGVRRELNLPEDVRQDAIKAAKKPIYG